MTIYDIIMLILTVVFGGLSLYLKTKTDLMEIAKYKIAEAESEYYDATKAGGEKFEWVVNVLYTYLPSPLRLVFTKESIGMIVQKVFDGVETYASIQIDKAVKKITEKSE